MHIVTFRYFPFPGKQELKNINFGKGICGAISKVAKLAPLFYCLKYTGGVKLFFETVGKAQCSDATTNAVFTYLGETVSCRTLLICFCIVRGLRR